VPELNRPGIGDAQHRRRMEARADHETSGQRLVHGVCADQRRAVLRAHAGGEAAMQLEPE
jgi:hypothetical protein